MEELYDIWETADSLDNLPEIPDFEEFIECDETIDVGYDVFWGHAYVYGPYAIIYDEEQFRRNLWGWSAQISYKDDNCVKSIMPAHKCNSAEEAYQELCEWLDAE